MIRRYLCRKAVAHLVDLATPNKVQPGGSMIPGLPKYFGGPTDQCGLHSLVMEILMVERAHGYFDDNMGYGSLMLVSAWTCFHIRVSVRMVGWLVVLVSRFFGLDTKHGDQAHLGLHCTFLLP